MYIIIRYFLDLHNKLRYLCKSILSKQIAFKNFHFDLIILLGKNE